jgi:hypothetical protein
MNELIHLEKIAEEIGTKHGEDYIHALGIQNSLTRRLREAALNGELICFDGFGRHEPKAHEGTIFTTAEAVNDWLGLIQSPYRYGNEQHGQPWLIPDDRDKPAASEDWHIAARYFYRQHKKANPELLKKDMVSFVLGQLQEHQLYKRGGLELPSIGAVEKILQNIEL